MQKGTLKQRLVAFLEDKGFYIVMGLCVVAIGVSGYVLFFTGGEKTPSAPVLVQQREETDTNVSGGVEGIPAERPEASHKPPYDHEETGEDRMESSRPQALAQDPQPAAAATEAPTEPTAPSTVQVSAPATVTQPVYALPVRESEILRGYSGDELIPDETMGDWRTHNGVDFLCDEGDEVLAVLAGSVERIYSDVMLGNCVLIDHGAGLKTLTCGLAAAEGIKEGMTVSAGQTIGRAGSTMATESALPCHVHLEMTENGLLIDPMSILKN